MDDIHLSTECGTRARIAPDCGFCCLSWSVGGMELLHLPVPEAEFRTRPKTGGVPLLYPYANRLRTDPWPDRPEVKRDGRLPCHGFLLRHARWTDLHVEGHRATAGLDWAADDELMSLFPHRHRLEISFEVTPGVLRATAVVIAGDEGPVPISFGWHPYLAPPGATHDALELELPPLERIRLDQAGLPLRGEDGELLADPPDTHGGSLAGRGLDALYRRVDEAGFGLSGPEVTIRVRPDRQTPFVQLYSPPDAAFACIEPMTAPVAALSDGRDLPILEAGQRFESSFELVVPADLGTSGRENDHG